MQQNDLVRSLYQFLVWLNRQKSAKDFFSLPGIILRKMTNHPSQNELMDVSLAILTAIKGSPLATSCSNHNFTFFLKKFPCEIKSKPSVKYPLFLPTS